MISEPALILLPLVDPDSGRFPDGQRTGPVVRGGALDQLVREGLVTDDDGHPTPTGTSDHPVLQVALDSLRERPSWRRSVARFGKETVEAAIGELVAAGLVVDGGRSFVRGRRLSLTPQGSELRSTTVADLGRLPEISEILEVGEQLRRVDKSAVAADGHVPEPIIDGLRQAARNRRVVVV